VAASQPQMEILAPPGMEELTSQIQGMLSNLRGGGGCAHEDPRGGPLLTGRRRAGLVNDDELEVARARQREQNGIVFLDEIDKITSRADVGAPTSRARASARTCCRWSKAPRVDPLWMVNTEHILFTPRARSTSLGPLDLIPELQGRFPIRRRSSTRCRSRTSSASSCRPMPAR